MQETRQIRERADAEAGGAMTGTTLIVDEDGSEDDAEV
jgi:hypothetical protein